MRSCLRFEAIYLAAEVIHQDFSWEPKGRFKGQWCERTIPYIIRLAFFLVGVALGGVGPLDSHDIFKDGDHVFSSPKRFTEPIVGSQCSVSSLMFFFLLLA